MSTSLVEVEALQLGIDKMKRQVVRFSEQSS